MAFSLEDSRACNSDGVRTLVASHPGPAAGSAVVDNVKTACATKSVRHTLYPIDIRPSIAHPKSLLFCTPPVRVAANVDAGALCANEVCVTKRRAGEGGSCGMLDRGRVLAGLKNDVPQRRHRAGTPGLVYDGRAREHFLGVMFF